MRALVDSAVFDSIAVDASDLVSLFQIALRGRHAVLPEPYEAPEFKAWLGQRDPKIREECHFALDLSLDQQKRVQPSFEFRITLTNKPRWDEPAELPLEEALRFLQLPLEIVFENGRNDRHFLFAVADRHQRDALRNALAERRIRFDHGGGLEEMLEHLKDVAKDPMRTRRSFWIFDSDALAPKHLSPTSRKLHQNCRRRRIGCHQLRRRSAESYLPVPAIRELWAQQDAVRKKRIRAFEKLSPHQRHYFNMKDGLNGDAKLLERYRERSKTERIAQAATALFQEFPPNVRSVLIKGFGRKIRDLFKNERLLREVDWFEQDGSRQEMHPVIEELLGRL